MTKEATAFGSTSREAVGCELAAEVLRSFGELRLRATGSSMLPAVWPGDILSVCSQDAATALPGDIVLFGREGRLFAHRVVEVRSSESGVRSPEKSEIGNWKFEIGNWKSKIENPESLTPNPQSLIPAFLEQSKIENRKSKVESPESRVFVTRGDSMDTNDPPISSHELLGRVIAIERGARRVHPRLTFWGKIASSILSRSEFCTRLLLHLRLRGWGLGIRDSELLTSNC